MAKRDKEFEWRMQGMTYAYNIAKEIGLEGLEKDIKMRGLLNFPIRFTTTQMEHFYTEVTDNVYQMMLLSACMALKENWKFGKSRLHEFKETYDRLVKDAVDLDYIGEHYVTFTDFARDLNEKYDIGIDMMTIEKITGINDKSNEWYHMARIERVIEELNENGFKDAAEFLGKKLW